MDKKEAFSNEEIIPDYLTLAMEDEARKTSDAKVTLPTPQGVAEAKEWVEENEK